MENAWWHVPGPNRYIDEVEHHLKEGRSVVIQHPGNLPASIRDAVEMRVTANDLWYWRTLDLADEHDCVDPLLLLTQRVVSDPGPASMQQLMDSCPDRVLWVDGIDGPGWSQWPDFLREFDHYARNFASPNHPLLCIHLARHPDPTPLRGLAVVKTCPWKHVVGRYDMLLFLAKYLAEDHQPGLIWEVRLHLCAELAGTDGNLAKHLATADLDTLVSPMSLLQTIAQSRHLNDSPDNAPSWQTGTQEYWDGRWRLNSCLAATRGDWSEIARRVWKAQVGVVFPFIEEQRIQLVPLVQPLLKFPFEDQHGETITDATDLEIGQLRHYAERSGVIGGFLRRLTLLHRMRRALAHVGPVTADDLRGAANLPLTTD